MCERTISCMIFLFIRYRKKMDKFIWNIWFIKWKLFFNKLIITSNYCFPNKFSLNFIYNEFKIISKYQSNIIIFINIVYYNCEYF